MVEYSGRLLAAQQSVEPVLERLDPPRRAAVVMALIALVLTGLLLVAIAMLGGHWVRRMARHRPGELRGKSSAESARRNRQLRESLRSVLPEDVPTGDTVHLDSASKETRVDP